jgi:hypothetical protein
MPFTQARDMLLAMAKDSGKDNDSGKDVVPSAIVETPLGGAMPAGPTYPSDPVDDEGLAPTAADNVTGWKRVGGNNGRGER